MLGEGTQAMNPAAAHTGDSPEGLSGGTSLPKELKQQVILLGAERKGAHESG